MQSEMPQVFDLSKEDDQTLAMYGWNAAARAALPGSVW